MTTDAYWHTAGIVCTQKEIEALKLRDLHGFGTRLIGHALGISRGAVRERLTNADRKIHIAMQNQTEETAA